MDMWYFTEHEHGMALVAHLHGMNDIASSCMLVPTLMKKVPHEGSLSFLWGTVDGFEKGWRRTIVKVGKIDKITTLARKKYQILN